MITVIHEILNHNKLKNEKLTGRFLVSNLKFLTSINKIKRRGRPRSDFSGSYRLFSEIIN